jgi:hypothetical protein
MKFDVNAWNQARLAIETNIRATKRRIRYESGGMASGSLWKALWRTKDEATRLYAIRATTHGRAHSGLQEGIGEFELKLADAAAIC